MEQRLQHFLPGNISQALCQTLVHSLWQGTLLALLAGFVMVLTKRSGAALRYRLLTGLLLLFTLCLFCTLFFELQAPPLTGNQIPEALEHGNLWAVLLSDLGSGLKYINEHAAAVSVFWLAIVVLKALRLLFGFYTLNRLKKVKVHQVTAFWEAQLTRLAKTMDIKRALILLESGIAKVPVVIGYLKPVILLPIGLINSLEQREVEAILLHELAHIRRNDHLVNLLQSLLETLLFFNPAVLWLSHLIRAERENCCDDMVLYHTQNKVGYIKALVRFEEHRVTTLQPALAFTGQNGGMVQRLERMVNNRNSTLNKLEVMGLALLLVITSLFVVLSPANSIRSVIKSPQGAVKPDFNRSEQAARERELKKKAEVDASKRRGQQDNSP
ncbi:M56 family metallopeptidase [Mucilaginibacter sp. OK098]|uniref:M56 family metallopeptidase n=1 Tax=Mucilaginibacter sp. OK098 TaxID=1855297 RepID=UPI00091DE88D|nr:M56 family metallopeptidase [Mucilaginibacter sp. OK098]SHN01777.1 Signal transducer regulating beta-lactamase production, contains metallopeptidase domain [Mucilaginibacter sp. OK098]